MCHSDILRGTGSEPSVSLLFLLSSHPTSDFGKPFVLVLSLRCLSPFPWTQGAGHFVRHKIFNLSDRVRAVFIVIFMKREITPFPFIYPFLLGNKSSNRRTAGPTPAAFAFYGQGVRNSLQKYFWATRFFI